MGLSNLPTELVQAIAELLSEKDVLVLAQLNRQFFDILIDYLYARNATRSNASALLWLQTKAMSQPPDKPSPMELSPQQRTAGATRLST